MKIIRCKNYEEMSRVAAKIVEAVVALKNDAVLGFATGSTPEGLYANLAADCKAGKADFSKTITVNLDEYCGLAADHPQSYRYFMNDKLFNHINIDMNNTHLPNGKAADLHAEAARYEKEVAALGYADLQVLGVGHNGHIGFNEPDTFLVQDTHVTDLTEDTIDANSRFFESANDVPKQALTMGIGTIMHAKKIILLASGANKRDAIATLFNGKVDPMSPVTVLNLHHDVTLLCDDAAWPL